MKKLYFLLIPIIFLSFQSLKAQSPDLQEYPSIPENLLNTEILLTQKGKKITLADYKNNVIVLSFVASWSSPARKTLSELKKLYAENPPNLKIIAVDIEDIKEEEGEKNQKSGVAVYRNGKILENRQKEEMLDFKKFVKTNKINFQTGWADKGFKDEFFEISKFDGIPQSFVIKNGKLRGVFLGASTKVNESLVNLVRKISTE